MTIEGRKAAPPRELWARALLVGTLACGPPADPEDGLPPAEPGTIDEPSIDDINFRPPSALAVEAGIPARLVVTVEPPGEHDVRFALLGDARDAFLTKSQVKTNAEGVAETELFVFSAASNFAVRAAVGTMDVLRSVVPLPASGGTLVIEPQYLGQRGIETWVASIHVNQTCADLGGFPYPEGTSSATASFGERAVRLERVEANTPLAAVVRAGQFAAGCRNIRAVSANADTLVAIDVTDRPLQMTDLTLDMAFGVEATEDLNPAFDELGFRAVMSLLGGASDDLASLLDAMAANSADAAAFETARSERNWRSVLVAELPPELPGSGLRTMIHDWMRAGLGRLNESDALRGSLGPATMAGTVPLVLSAVMDLTPEAAGFTAANLASFSVGADDLLGVGVTLDFLPSPLLAAAATSAALVAHPQQFSVPDAMAVAFGCDDIAALLADAGDAGEAFPGCNEACMLTLCRGAMAGLWSRVVNSNLPSVAWQISATARAEIDSDARPVSLAGSWKGTLAVADLGSGPTSIGGEFAGTRR